MASRVVQLQPVHDPDSKFGLLRYTCPLCDWQGTYADLAGDHVERHQYVDPEDGERWDLYQVLSGDYDNVLEGEVIAIVRDDLIRPGGAR